MTPDSTQIDCSASNGFYDADRKIVTQIGGVACACERSGCRLPFGGFVQDGLISSIGVWSSASSGRTWICSPLAVMIWTRCRPMGLGRSGSGC